MILRVVAKCMTGSGDLLDVTGKGVNLSTQYEKRCLGVVVGEDLRILSVVAVRPSSYVRYSTFSVVRAPKLPVPPWWIWNPDLHARWVLPIPRLNCCRHRRGSA